MQASCSRSEIGFSPSLVQRNVRSLTAYWLQQLFTLSSILLGSEGIPFFLTALLRPRLCQPHVFLAGRRAGCSVALGAIILWVLVMYQEFYTFHPPAAVQGENFVSLTLQRRKLRCREIE